MMTLSLIGVNLHRGIDHRQIFAGLDRPRPRRNIGSQFNVKRSDRRPIAYEGNICGCRRRRKFFRVALGSDGRGEKWLRSYAWRKVLRAFEGEGSVLGKNWRSSRHKNRIR